VIGGGSGGDSDWEKVAVHGARLGFPHRSVVTFHLSLFTFHHVSPYDFIRSSTVELGHLRNELVDENLHVTGQRLDPS
jgi:hypothetical protein